MPQDNKQKKKGADFRAMFTLAGEKSNVPGQYEAVIAAQYPDVPTPYNQIWARSDEHTRKGEQWQTLLADAATKAQRAAELCRELSTATDHTERATLHQQIEQLSQAICALEEISTELRFLYPLPEGRLDRIKLTAATETSQEGKPQLLHRTNDLLLIYMPRMPRYSNRKDGSAITDFKELLGNSSLGRWPNWHCDFIHVFPPDNSLGVKDVDNYPYKQIIDALTIALQTQDSAEHFSCSMYNYFCATIAPGCYLRITNRSEKVGFFTQFENEATAAKQVYLSPENMK